jgi:hypothetical protein
VFSAIIYYWARAVSLSKDETDAYIAAAEAQEAEPSA